MRCSRLLPPLAAAIALLAFSPARADILININKAEQRMTVVVDGDPRFIWPVSTGLANYDTPAGEFQPFRMERHHFSREWDDAPMPHSIFFTQEGHAIHGSYHVKNLGRPASHGCVRLAPANAAILFALVREHRMKNARVTLSGEIPAPSPAPSPAVARRDPGVRAANAEPAPPRRTRVARGGGREIHDTARAYYYRPRPYYVQRYYGRGLFFPFGF